MLFLDTNDLGSVLAKRSRNRRLSRELVYYKEKIKQVQNDHLALKSSINEVERFGRENYNMKKENEDLYIIVNETED